MTTIYRTRERPGYGKSYYWNEYRLEGDIVTMYRCSKHKFFDGRESNWEPDENTVGSWQVDDPAMPDWLRKHL